jgi:Divergent InlB B-repeat domain
MILGNCVGCTPTTNYTLTMSSTAGGSVTPAVGAHNYSAGTVVNLTATADSGYRFVNWTGGGADIGNATAAATTITMNADHTVTAHFALGTLIAGVPDTNQPPTSGSPNYCAPMAMINVLKYWDVPTNNNAYNVTAGLPANTAADLLGWFMDTNNIQSPGGPNDNDHHSGTYDKDIGPGTTQFARWDTAHNFTITPPAGKLGYNWMVTENCTTDPVLSLALYENEIDNGRPLVVSFTYWNPVSTGINVTDPQTGETISVFTWGTPVSYSTDPVEYWEPDIGHAVTGVGYILNWNPGGSAPEGDYVIVHDNWASTPENVAIPWQNWKCLFAVDPGSYEHLTP